MKMPSMHVKGQIMELWEQILNGKEIFVHLRKFWEFTHWCSQSIIPGSLNPAPVPMVLLAWMTQVVLVFSSWHFKYYNFEVELCCFCVRGWESGYIFLQVPPCIYWGMRKSMFYRNCCCEQRIGWSGEERGGFEEADGYPKGLPPLPAK